MSQWQKLLDKIYSLSGDVRYNDLKKILESYGYKLSPGKGSHAVFRKAGADSITIPVHDKKVKATYIALVAKAIKHTKGGKR